MQRRSGWDEPGQAQIFHTGGCLMKISCFKKMLSLSAIAVLLTGGVVPAHAFSYSIVKLDGPDGSAFTAKGINNRGQIVGASVATDGSFYATLLTVNGAMNLGTQGRLGSVATGINDRGQVVGYSYMNHARYEARAFLWSNGVMQDLENPGGEYARFTSSQAVAINNRGQIVGDAINPNSGSDQVQAIFWANGSAGSAQTLPDELSSKAYAVDNHGRAAGVLINNDSGVSHAAFWNNGVVQRLEVLPPVKWDTLSSALDINDRGQVVGLISGHLGPTLWTDGVAQDLGTLAGAAGGVNGYGGARSFYLNNPGQLAGYSMSADGSNHATLWSGGNIYDLTTLINNVDGWTDLKVGGLNNMGQIIGNGLFNGQEEAFLLNPEDNHPVPEPSTIFLLASGMAALFVLRFRNRAFRS